MTHCGVMEGLGTTRCCSRPPPSLPARTWSACRSLLAAWDAPQRDSLSFLFCSFLLCLPVFYFYFQNHLSTLTETNISGGKKGVWMASHKKPRPCDSFFAKAYVLLNATLFVIPLRREGFLSARQMGDPRILAGKEPFLCPHPCFAVVKKKVCCGLLFFL